MGLLHFLRGNTFSHGVHPPQHKDLTNALAIRRLPFAPRMILPLAQHFGAPSIPIVHEGQEVVRGQPIAEADGFLSVPLHSPATGVIEKFDLVHTVRGPKTKAIILKLYPGASQEVLYEINQDVDAMEPDQLITAVQHTGMVGLGGATFPTHVKLSPPKKFPIDTVLVNGCECEPYITSDHRIMLEHTADLIRGIRIVLKAVGAKRAVIGIEDNKIDAVEAIRAKLPPGTPITVELVKTKYPQGSEKMLITALLDREVPSGGYPYHIGVSPFNVATLAQLGALLPRGQGLIERVVTISGSGVTKPGNYIVALGTPLRFVLEQVGYYGSHDKLIFGGPMMGMTISSLDVPVTKGISSIVVQTEEEQAVNVAKKVYPCIRCAACVEACPIHLNPSQLGLLAAKHEYEIMQQRYHLNDCFECGSCSYVCPSGIPLVQYFRIAKAVNRERQT